MICIKERKVKEDGQLLGYILERDGISFVVSMRDLYEADIVKQLTEAGYKYHDYYGDIENEAGIDINMLSSSAITAGDNMSFYGCFESSVLTEQQMMQFMSLNMNKIPTIEFRQPVKVLISTREQLITYLLGFRKINQKTYGSAPILPLNAICAPEVLFTVEELELNTDLLVYFDYISRRRSFATRTMLNETKKFFLNQGLLEEDEFDNPDLFIKAWCAWGPEGIRTKCIEQRYMQDVVFPCDELYTGTGEEEITFESKVRAIASKVTTTSLSRVYYTYGYGLIDKSGNLYYDGNVVTPDDIISNRGNILIMDTDQQQYNKLRREADKWETPYKIIDVCQIHHINRMCFTLQEESGKLYQYRMDRQMMALVSSHARIFSSVFGTVRLENGNYINFDKGFSKDVIVEQIVFRTLVKEMLSNIIEEPVFPSTVAMCNHCGLHYEQMIDYIEYLRGNKEASPILHDALPSYFYSVFGENLSELDSSATLVDKLELLMENLEDKTDTESSNYIDMASIIEDTFRFGTDIYNAALYVMGENPISKFSAVLDFDTSTCAGEQLEGRIRDSKEGFIGPMINLVKSAYKINHKEYNPNVLLTEIEKIRSGDYFNIEDKILSPREEYNGCLVDYSKLKVLQLSTALCSVWVMGVISEVSAVPVADRRHLAFYGWKMDISKGSGIYKIISRMKRDIDLKSKSDLTYRSDEYCIKCVRYFYSSILRIVWSVRTGNSLFKPGADGCLHHELTARDGLGYTHTVDVVLTQKEYDYIVNPACSDFTVFTTTLYEWCRYAMQMDFGTLNFYAVAENVYIDPWYVKVKEGYSPIPIYNGAINLISTQVWENVYRTQATEMYNDVKRVGGRAPICVVDNNVPRLFKTINNDVIDIEIFKEENNRLGVNSQMLPKTMMNYFLADNKTETTDNYYRRVVHSISDAPAGKRIYRLPLKSDVYYSNIAVVYNYEIPEEVEYREGIAKPSDDRAPFILSSGDSDKLLDVNTAKIYKFSEYQFMSADLVQCASLIMGEYENKVSCTVGTRTIIFPDGTYKSVSSITRNDLTDLCSQKCAYQVNGNVYVIYASNGAFVCEV